MPAVYYSPIQTQTSRKGFFGRLRRPTMATSAVLPTAISTAPSTASSTPSVHGSIEPNVNEQIDREDQLHQRCEELAMQSQLNQAMFQQCFEDLLAKETENKELQDLKTSYEATIFDMKKRNCELEDRLRLANRESINLKSHEAQQGFLTEEAMTDGKHIRALELQVSVLATQLAKVKDTDFKRDKLFTKFKEHQQQLVDFYTEEQQSHLQQNKANIALHNANQENHQRLEKTLQDQETTILELKKKLDMAEKSVTSVINSRYNEKADLNDNMRREEFDLEGDGQKATDCIAVLEAEDKELKTEGGVSDLEFDTAKSRVGPKSCIEVSDHI
ncbi:Nn.00g093340.m01.CDS01 [Neocucurbitaria sp. VM-36]